MAAFDLKDWKMAGIILSVSSWSWRSGTSASAVGVVKSADVASWHAAQPGLVALKAWRWKVVLSSTKRVPPTVF